jgi:hypothetical protein
VEQFVNPERFCTARVLRVSTIIALFHIKSFQTLITEMQHAMMRVGTEYPCAFEITHIFLPEDPPA